jgi:diacylglycerol kinase (ATP)
MEKSMSDGRRYKFIVNPHSGRGKSRGIDAALHRILSGMDVRYEIAMTSMLVGATEIAKHSAREFDVLVAVGGDGTANEVANGMVSSDASLGVIPSGSGNDFAKLLGMDDNLKTSVNQIIQGRPLLIDTGNVSLEDISGKKTSRIFVNSIGIGFDAIVAYEAQRIKFLKGVPLYLAAILRSLKRLRPQLFQISANGNQESENYYLVCVGNGNREGGGFFVTPKANPTDGVFEVCTVKQVPLLKALRIVPTILKGQHGQFPEVKFFSTRRITVESEKPFIVHCDGEILGTENTRIEIEVRPKSLGVIVGRDGLKIIR